MLLGSQAKASHLMVKRDRIFVHRTPDLLGGNAVGTVGARVRTTSKLSIKPKEREGK